MQYTVTLSLDVADNNDDRTWTIYDKNGDVELAGQISGLDPNSEDFDFDEATAKISEAAGVKLENVGIGSGCNAIILYWDVIGSFN